MATHERAILEQRQKHPPARVKRRQPLRLEHARVGRPLLEQCHRHMFIDICSSAYVQLGHRGGGGGFLATAGVATEAA